jgi:adenine/guanine phosphoribosyltransferase-like PRPP-binding protein
MDHFNKVIASIRWTKDHPKPGILFCDLSTTFGTPALTQLTKIVVQALCIDTNHVILGVPTRGNTWAALLASVSGARAFFLGKEGVGTPVPGTIPFCSASTVYSGDKKTNFTVRADVLEQLLQAPVIWVADDVCESGSTLNAVISFLQEKGCKVVRGIPLISFKQEHDHVIYHNTYSLPGRSVFGSSPQFLCTLRGGDQKPYDIERAAIIYGPPSMNHLMETYKGACRPSCMADIQWNTFSGGMPNIHFDVPLHNAIFFYDAGLDSTTQDGLVHALARSCTNLTIFVPYLPQGTMERVDEEGTLAIAQTRLHSLCGAMPIGGARVAVEIVDIHQTGTRFYLGDRVIYVPRSKLTALVDADCTATAIAFPDEGARKRFAHRFPGYTQLVFSKKRGPKGERIIELSDTVGNGSLGTKLKHVTIVDDLVRTGGTILVTARILRSMGFTWIEAAFVHADFDPGTVHAFANDPALDRIVTTDSVPQKARALLLAAPTKKVEVHNLFLDDYHVDFSKRVGDFTILASASNTKYDALRLDIPGIYTMAVPNGPTRPEQPLSEKEGEAAALDRIAVVRHLWPKALRIVAIESYIDATDGYDKVCFVISYWYRGEEKTTIGHSVPNRSVRVPPEFLELCLKPENRGKITAGELMQKAWNLPTKDAWIAHVGGDRKQQIMSARYNGL